MAKAKSQISARDRMRNHRDRIKSDPQLHEENKRRERERYKRRVEEGKIKKASSQMSERERRKLRKTWREKTRKYRAHTKYVEDIMSPPASPPAAQAEDIQHEQRERDSCDKRKQSGKKKRRKHQAQLKSKIKSLEMKLKKMEKKVSKYKQRLSRTNQTNLSRTKNTPRKLVKNMLVNQRVSPAIKKRLLFCSVIENQITESFKKEKCAKKKRDFVTKMAGGVVKKYRFVETMKSLTSKRMVMGALSKKTKLITSEAQEIRANLKKSVKEFFLQDENSRSTAGRKETITRGKLKKQKRFMNDSIKNLYDKFIKTFPETKVSYSLFCLYRPFWVLYASAKDRDTCLCKTHENFDILIKKLKTRNLINESSPHKVLEAMTCKEKGIDCMERKCSKCEGQNITFSDLDSVDKTTLSKWVTKKHLITVKGKEKMVKKTVKVQIEYTNQGLADEFNDTVFKYLQHVANIKHQYQITDKVKEKLGKNDILIHMDFSENYSCKYASEVQSSHFGASKGQISLHTVVVYYVSKETMLVENKCFATLSDNLRHDAAAIFAHLQPVVKEMKTCVGDIKTVHFLTDGPTTQYRNRTIFYLLGNYVPIMFDSCSTVHWHYSEAGHGKGAPDGIGGCLKRTADRLVAQGKDVTNCKIMLKLLSEEVKNIQTMEMDESFLRHIDQFLPDQKTIRAFKGTMQTHEVVWARNSNTLQFRRLSCLDCKPSGNCSHYGLGDLQLTPKPIITKKLLPKKLNVEEVYTDSDDEPDDPRPEQDMSPNDFVVVQVKGKKTTQQFIAVVEEVNLSSDEATVSFLKNSIGDKFIFPSIEDKSDVDLKDIIQILNPPQINKRGHHLFKNVKVDFPKLQ